MDNKLLPIPQCLKGQEVERAEIIVFEHLSKGTVGISQALGRMTTHYLPEVYAEISELVDMLSQQITSDNFREMLIKYFKLSRIWEGTSWAYFNKHTEVRKVKNKIFIVAKIDDVIKEYEIIITDTYTISDLISDCKRNGILLTWRSE